MSDSEPTLYDDTYTGPRWTYGLTYRPLTGACVPRGWIVFSDRRHPRYAHGTVDYPRALTPEEVAGYQLEPLARDEAPTKAQPACDCIHAAAYHDPATGACLVTNPHFGPCPCAATPAETLAALGRAFRLHLDAERRSGEHHG